MYMVGRGGRMVVAGPQEKSLGEVFDLACICSIPLRGACRRPLTISIYAIASKYCCPGSEPEVSTPEAQCLCRIFGCEFRFQAVRDVCGIAVSVSQRNGGAWYDAKTIIFHHDLSGLRLPDRCDKSSLGEDVSGEAHPGPLPIT